MDVEWNINLLEYLERAARHRSRADQTNSSSDMNIWRRGAVAGNPQRNHRFALVFCGRPVGRSPGQCQNNLRGCGRAAGQRCWRLGRLGCRVVPPSPLCLDSVCGVWLAPLQTCPVATRPSPSTQPEYPLQMPQLDDRSCLHTVSEELENLEIDETNEAPDPALLRKQFKLFAKFGDKAADGTTIKLSQSDKWFKQAGVIQAKGVTTTDTGIAFRKVAK